MFISRTIAYHMKSSACKETGDLIGVPTCEVTVRSTVDCYPE